MKRKHKTYSRPKRPFDKKRLDDEAKIKEEFGLKNKREIWKADAKINQMRTRAKKLIHSSQEEQKAFLEKLNKIGMNVSSLGDVLSLDKKDYLKRRLQTVVSKKNLAGTSKSARQLIAHKKVLVNGRIVDSPSYIVPVEFEKGISLKKKKAKEIKKVKKKEEKSEEEEKNE